MQEQQSNNTLICVGLDGAEPCRLIVALYRSAEVLPFKTRCDWHGKPKTLWQSLLQADLNTVEENAGHPPKLADCPRANSSDPNKDAQLFRRELVRLLAVRHLRYTHPQLVS
jgi:hypothetical protein